MEIVASPDGDIFAGIFVKYTLALYLCIVSWITYMDLYRNNNNNNNNNNYNNNNNNKIKLFHIGKGKKQTISRKKTKIFKL